MPAALIILSSGVSFDTPAHCLWRFDMHLISTGANLMHLICTYTCQPGDHVTSLCIYDSLLPPPPLPLPLTHMHSCDVEGWR